MAEKSKAIIEHKAGVNQVIALDLKRLRQEFDGSYSVFLALVGIVNDPSRIRPNGP
jgi:hypothetical protein